jgi:hypothetical protein
MNRKNLRLNREYLSELDAVDLRVVAGAGPTDADTCMWTFLCTATQTATQRPCLVVFGTYLCV